MAYFSFKDIKTTYDMCLCLEEVSSFVNAQQTEQQPSPRKNRKPKAPKGNFQIRCIFDENNFMKILLNSILFDAKYFLDF